MGKTYVICDHCGQMNRVQVQNQKQAVCGSCKTNLPIHDYVINGTDKYLQKLIQKSPVPVVIDVWASWCGPCRSFAPTFQEASEKFSDRCVFVKLDSENNQLSAGQLGIRSIPTIIIFKNGKEIARQSGALPREHFHKWLEQFT